MNRNRNIEMVRGIAVLCIVFYHYSISIPGIINSPLAVAAVEGLCQIAMCIFFAISGFGTYCYLEKQPFSIKPSQYLKKRFKRLAPPYYICTAIILLTTGTAYLAWNQGFKVLTVLTFCHNLFPSTNGAINGVTWTIALMMQFYALAVPLYTLVHKYGYKFYVLIAVVTFAVRITISRYILLHNISELNYVVYSIRQIYTTVDIFVAGMCAAKFCSNRSGRSVQYAQAVSIGIGAALFITFMAFTYTQDKLYVWGSNWRSWLWQPILGAETALLLVAVAQLRNKYQSKGGRFIQFIAENEYGIYLWHMVLFQNISAGSPAYAGLLNRSPMVVLVGMIALAVAVGAAFNRLLKV